MSYLGLSFEIQIRHLLHFGKWVILYTI